MGAFHCFNYHSCGGNYKGVQSLRLNESNRERFNNVSHPVANRKSHQIRDKESNNNDN